MSERTEETNQTDPNGVAGIVGTETTEGVKDAGANGQSVADGTTGRGTVPNPSIGRIVHYRHLDGTVLPGIITAVLNDDMTVNLTVFAERGVLQERKVSYSDFDVEKPEPGTWFWPPRVA